jgi:ElaA protein
MPADAAACLPDTVTLRWQWGRLAELAVADLYAVMVARQEVFVVEQCCAFLDADGLDAHAYHLLGWAERDAKPALAGYLRVVDPGRRFAEPSIGRVLTAAPYRGTGLGRRLMQEGLLRARRAFPGRPIRIAAQQHLEGFYASLGFHSVGAPFLEDGIPHVEMIDAPAGGGP